MDEYNYPGPPRSDGDLPASYFNLALMDDGSPLCPECGTIMFQRKEMIGFNTWECSNDVCPLIEGEYSRRDNYLWDIHYEAKPIDFYVTEEK